MSFCVNFWDTSSTNFYTLEERQYLHSSYDQTRIYNAEYGSISGDLYLFHALRTGNVWYGVAISRHNTAGDILYNKAYGDAGIGYDEVVVRSDESKAYIMRQDMGSLRLLEINMDNGSLSRAVQYPNTDYVGDKSSYYDLNWNSDETVLFFSATSLSFDDTGICKWVIATSTVQWMYHNTYIYAFNLINDNDFTLVTYDGLGADDALFHRAT